MSPEGPRPKLENRLIRSLPRPDRQRLEERLEPVYLPYMELLYGAGEPILYVHFPTNRVLSLLAEAAGGAVEVAAVGNEGLAGLPLFPGGVDRRPPHHRRPRGERPAAGRPHPLPPGKLTVLDRQRLEAAACDCHARLNQELEKLLGPVKA